MNRTSSRRTAPKAKFGAKDASLLIQCYGEKSAQAILIQYGGSVKPENAAALLHQPDVDGGLIGGAALKADSFLAIVNAAK